MKTAKYRIETIEADGVRFIRYEERLKELPSEPYCIIKYTTNGTKIYKHKEFNYV